MGKPSQLFSNIHGMILLFIMGFSLLWMPCLSFVFIFFEKVNKLQENYSFTSGPLTRDLLNLWDEQSFRKCRKIGFNLQYIVSSHFLYWGALFICVCAQCSALFSCFCYTTVFYRDELIVPYIGKLNHWTAKWRPSNMLSLPCSCLYSIHDFEEKNPLLLKQLLYLLQCSTMIWVQLQIVCRCIF